MHPDTLGNRRNSGPKLQEILSSQGSLVCHVASAWKKRVINQSWPKSQIQTSIAVADRVGVGVCSEKVSRTNVILLDNAGGNKDKQMMIIAKLRLRFSLGSNDGSCIFTEQKWEVKQNKNKEHVALCARGCNKWETLTSGAKCTIKDKLTELWFMMLKWVGFVNTCLPCYGTNAKIPVSRTAISRDGWRKCLRSRCLCLPLRLAMSAS